MSNKDVSMTKDDDIEEITLFVKGKEIKFPHTVTLQCPIKVGASDQLTEVVFKKPPIWSDLRYLSVDQSGVMTMDNHIPLTSKLTGVPVTDLSRLVTCDVSDIMRFLSPFLE